MLAIYNVEEHSGAGADLRERMVTDNAGAEDEEDLSPQDYAAPLHIGGQTGAAYTARIESESSENSREDQLMMFLYPRVK